MEYMTCLPSLYTLYPAAECRCSRPTLKCVRAPRRSPELQHPVLFQRTRHLAGGDCWLRHRQGFRPSRRSGEECIEMGD